MINQVFFDFKPPRPICGIKHYKDWHRNICLSSFETECDSLSQTTNINNFVILQKHFGLMKLKEIPIILRLT